jgi:hypothetical protein
MIVIEGREARDRADKAGVGHLLRSAKEARADIVVPTAGRVFGAFFRPGKPRHERGYLLLQPESAEEWAMMELRLALTAAGGQLLGGTRRRQHRG